ncbi:uncharacterized protein LOC114941949 [Nylanderia fulva]|uniref:uncharacterized protein LOC114941949 n=1 Tax=Nylanderia fulva TaxID=613905 RepID=UPI0010FB79BE|nr:uncharacterized protein LOC114941949 [Nylanderia fulva]
MARKHHSIENTLLHLIRAIFLIISSFYFLLFRSNSKAWQPNKNSRICNLHFEGSKRSEDPTTAAYNPTIFPSIYRKRNVENSQRTERVKRQQRKLQFVPSGSTSFVDIKTDSDMKQLAGISLSMFQILLAFIKPLTHGQPKYYKEYFSYFCVKYVDHFYNVLETLHENTKTWIFWPSRKTIRSSMPSVFKNYPNCRAIIDCTEIRTDTPPLLDKRALMYSSYKSDFTVKYLIGINPFGKITFLSKGYGDRSTDCFIVVDRALST